MGHVVTFHFHSFRVKQEKKVYSNETKPHNCTRLVQLEASVDENPSAVYYKQNMKQKHGMKNSKWRL